MLPEHETDKLKELYQKKDRQPLMAYIAALRKERWTLQDIANALGTTRSTIQYWENKNQNECNDSDIAVSVRKLSSYGVKTKKSFAEIPVADQERMAYLSQQAKKIGNKTPVDSPLHALSQELDEIIYKHLLRLVPVSKIAEACHVTHRAIRARYERSNFVV